MMRETTQANGQKLLFDTNKVSAYAETDSAEKTRIYTVDGRLFEVLEKFDNFRPKPEPSESESPAKTEVKK